MNLPPFFYSLAFWQSAVYVVAALFAYLTPYKLEAAVLLAVVLAVLKMFSVVPEFRATFGSEWKYTVPPFFYILAFWQSLAYVVAALVACFTQYKLESGVLLILVLAILKMFNIVPELRAKGLLN